MMRRSILSLFSRRKAADHPVETGTTHRRNALELPPSVIACVEAAMIVVRSGSREEGPRAVIAFPGRAGWTFDTDNAARVFSDGWPDLTPGQVKAAVSRLACRVHLAMQQFAHAADPAAGNDARRPFIDRY